MASSKGPELKAAPTKGCRSTRPGQRALLWATRSTVPHAMAYETRKGRTPTEGHSHQAGDPGARKLTPGATWTCNDRR